MAPPKCAGKCRKAVTANTMALHCEMCAAWVRIVSSNISEGEYKFLARKGLGKHWVCKKCNTAALDGFKMIQTLQDKMTQSAAEEKN